MSDPAPHPDAMDPFVGTIQRLAQVLAERDEALAALARVRALCDSNAGCATRDGALMVSTIRAALDTPTQGA